MKIIPIPAFNDNYIWVIVNELLSQAVVVDPGEADSVIQFLKTNQLNLIGILLTHKHADHTGGVAALVEAYPGVAVYAHALENIAFTTHAVEQGELISMDEWEFKVMPIPGHTLGHVAYHSHPILFSGDTLFAAGCGRVFEGTPAQMLHSLNLLAALPDETLIYCGHEYTLANLKFALCVEPQNVAIQARIQSVEKMRQQNHPSLPSTMALEKQTNPFLRCEAPTVIASAEKYAGRTLANTVDVFHALREWKNHF